MRQLSLHILDIMENSIAAGSRNIYLYINESIMDDFIMIVISDDGKGISASELEMVIDPFYTSRKTRKVGLGIPLFKANAEGCNGSFQICSQPGVGTEVSASFQYSHLDRVPLGDIAATITAILMVSGELNLILDYWFNGHQFCFNSEDIKEILQDVSLETPLILDWISMYLRENIAKIKLM